MQSQKEASRHDISGKFFYVLRECKTCWTCLQMRRFEKVGLTRTQAEQVTELLTETICMNKVKITEQFVSKAALEKVLPQLFWPGLMPAVPPAAWAAFDLHSYWKQDTPENAFLRPVRHEASA